jgi:hypothetical protein
VFRRNSAEQVRTTAQWRDELLATAISEADRQEILTVFARAEAGPAPRGDLLQMARKPGL